MGSILARLYPRLRSRALRLTQRQDAANDLVQDVCERALSRWHSHRAELNPDAWLARVMRNLFIDEYRTQRFRARAEAALVAQAASVPAEVEPGAATAPSPVQDRLGPDDIHGAIEALPPSYRSLLQLAHVERLSYRAIAQRTGLPVRTVGTRLHRGRRSLRTLLEERHRNTPAPFQQSMGK